MKKRQVVILALFTLLAIVVTSCKPYDYNLPPGCQQSYIMGGCFAVNLIRDIEVTPQMDCLKVESFSCNGPYLSITNSCEETLLIYDNVLILNDSQEQLFDIVPRSFGKFGLAQANFSAGTIPPLEDQSIELYGSIGLKNVKIALTRTKPSC